MKQFLVRHLRGTPPYRLLRWAVYRWRVSSLNAPLLARQERRALDRWQKAGRPIPPPPPVKRALIRRYADEFGLRVFVETGTYTGGTVTRLLRRFDRIVSMELSEELAGRARRLFGRHPHVSTLQGDSAVLLPRVVASLEGPALFWLDAHYSGGITARGTRDTPILDELETILGSDPGHVVLIDDARDFRGTNDYPTIEEVRAFVAARRPDLLVEVGDDVIRITPR